MTRVPASFAELMHAMGGEEEERPTRRTKILPEAFADNLRECAMIMSTPHQHKVGDFVTQRPGMAIYTIPEVGDPAVVMEVIEERETEDTESHSQVEYIDMVIGVTVPGKSGVDAFLQYRVDGRRFKAWSPE